ncbi:expressed unknown protein [Seminavis robusta]|uniref:Uncharacterized protein n=1 Tax=Seminavis robusta TaxID=568900 RepID=A0A9N8DZM7_9STRA|nr:expressed unknown protein [Seminavis robusta]|eukprot:Sro368_g128000.1 n/a (346) ;mRNA; f:42637-43674
METLTHTKETTSPDDSALSMLGSSLDLRRFDTLVHAGPMDFRGYVHEIPNHELDWNTTIFYTVTNPAITARLQERFGKRPLWADSVIEAACETARTLPPQQYHVPSPIMDYMTRECEFKNEHADGGFIDHLDFCAEYTTRYFPQGSPHVLFLHSICGVNTNLFPLEFDKIPDLKSLLTDHEYLHVQAFPAMLRLLFMDEVLGVLWDEDDVVDRVEGVEFSAFHGTKLTLVGEEFWMHLNYHLIHLLDFMPTQNFDRFLNDPFVRLFVRLHEFLRKQDKLYATVRLDRLGQVEGMTAPNETLPTWDHLLSRLDADEVAKAHEQLRAQLRRYSKAIDHDLAYEILWK